MPRAPHQAPLLSSEAILEETGRDGGPWLVFKKGDDREFTTDSDKGGG